MEKIKEWFKKTGLENLGWAAAGVGSLIFISGGVGTFLAGACTGLFIYFNYAVIKELVLSIK